MPAEPIEKTRPQIISDLIQQRKREIQLLELSLEKGEDIYYTVRSYPDKIETHDKLFDIDSEHAMCLYGDRAFEQNSIHFMDYESANKKLMEALIKDASYYQKRISEIENDFKERLKHESDKLNETLSELCLLTISKPDKPCQPNQ